MISVGGKREKVHHRREGEMGRGEEKWREGREEKEGKERELIKIRKNIIDRRYYITHEKIEK